MGRLDNRIAIVTGGASGIGRACALALAAEGAIVMIGDVDEKGGVETVEAATASKAIAHFCPLDVAQEDDWKTIVAMTAQKFGALHILVNNAAICIARPLLEMSFESWRRQMAINLDGLFLGTKAALPLMARSGGGSIVNMSSVAGLRGIPGMSATAPPRAACGFSPRRSRWNAPRPATTSASIRCIPARSRRRSG